MTVPAATSHRLRDLLPELHADAAAVHVSNLALDSRQLRPGGLFLACAGRSSHGLQHVANAISNGARAIVFDASDSTVVPQFPPSVFAAQVPQLAARAGEIADRFFHQPSAQLQVAGITGTNGKTTCAWLLANALRLCDRPSAYIGTLGIGMAGERPALDASLHTTPDVVSVHRALDELRRQGAQCVAMEVSSHALDQGRIDAVRIHAAAFTNLTRDHLDYHASMDAYGAAKARLFARPELAARVINADDDFAPALIERRASASRLILTARLPCGVQRAAAVAGAELLRGQRVSAEADGLHFEVSDGQARCSARLALIGEFNVDNALTVLGMLRALDVPLALAVSVLAACRAPPGRMEAFRSADSALVIVDYAHTPDALSKALHAARAHCRGRLRLVFGCGGDRDRGKRPLMAQAAAAAADELVLTDDNPRTEAPQQIVADMVAGLPPQCRYSIVHDRAQAIEQTLAVSRREDVLLIAGKGHETCQIYGTARRAFSDQSVVTAVLGAGS